MNRRLVLAALVFAGVGLLVVAGAVALSGAQPTPTLTSTPTRLPTLTPTAPPPVKLTSPEVERVSLAVAKEAYDARTAVFVDVRALASYNGGHVAGALSIPENELADRLGELKPTDWIITYCT
jgi:3-mercaptopyruvate sulfurtransferase SseA